jgi:hypothetical protein
VANADHFQLADVNAVVRLCRLLPVGYDRFTPADISVEFKEIKNVAAEGVYQVSAVHSVGIEVETSH